MRDVVLTTNRNTGRTSRMIEALQAENTPTVVVHSQAMADYVRGLAYQLRPDLRHPIRVRIVNEVRSCDYLRGVRFVVDHAVWDFVNAETAALLQALMRPRLASTI